MSKVYISNSLSQTYHIIHLIFKYSKHISLGEYDIIIVLLSERVFMLELYVRTISINWEPGRKFC